MKYTKKEKIKNLIIYFIILFSFAIAVGIIESLNEKKEKYEVIEVQPLTTLMTSTEATKVMTKTITTEMVTTTIESQNNITDNSLTPVSTITVNEKTKLLTTVIQLTQTTPKKEDIVVTNLFYENIENNDIVTDWYNKITVNQEYQSSISEDNKTEIIETTETDVTTQIEPTTVKDFIVFKPSTHYIHTSSCHWYDSTCYEISTTDGLEVLYCIECKPDIEIYNYYQPVIETDYNISNDDRELLAQIVWHEAGSDWIDIYDKAMVAAGVMNRVNDSRFPSTVYKVLTQAGQFTGFIPYTCVPTQSCYDAVDYYFNNIDSFGNYNSWYGNGYSNTFYYQ